MRRVSLHNLSWFLCFVFLLTAAACQKRPPPRAPSPGPSRSGDIARDRRAGPLPTVTLTASPSTVERGEQTTLSWTTTETMSLLIDSGIGNVADSGSLVISPRESTTYTATATGPGGEATSSTRVTVVPRSARGMITSTDLDGLQQAIEEGKIQPLFFEYDQAGITAEGERVLKENARWFQQFPNATIVIEGHCDERGTEEYNLALGDRRAQAVKAYLVQLGVDPNRMETISFDRLCSPSTVERGEQTTLSWTTTETMSLLIDSGIGNVADSGSLVISPRESTTYTATATGPGGEATSSTRVTVVPRSARGMITSTDLDGLQQAIEEGKIQPLFFEYDQAGITAEGERVLKENARWFQQFPNATIVIEGHCDERGTEEYNLALGDRRAQAVKAYLVQLGIDPDRMESISFGEERPFAPGYDEAAYRLNRRAHFIVKGVV